jgi:hypothetical protein
MLLVACATAQGGEYRIDQDESGQHWIVDPEGNRFLSIGINAIDPQDHNPPPGSIYYDPIPNQFGGDAQAWVDSVCEILAEAGHNTIGAWSDPLMNGSGPHETIILYVAEWWDERCLFGLRSDFEDLVRSRMEEMLTEWPDQSRVMGFFLDNEMRWYGDSPWSEVPNHTMLEYALEQEEFPEIREAALTWLRDRYDTVQDFAEAWHVQADTWESVDAPLLRRGMTDAAHADRSAFIEHAAELWFERSTAVVREMAPGKLILGVRFAGHAPEEVIRACGRHCDVISFNDYRFGDSADPDPRRMAQMWVLGGRRPLMITEYSWRAAENQSGNPNTGGAGTVVQTQAERGRRNTVYLEQLFEYPFVVGAHWFDWADQSPQGRFDGENSNYGIVDIHHGRYEELIAAMADVNSRVEAIHAASTMEAPDSIPEPPAVVFEPGQRPERPPSIDLIAVPPAEEPAGWSAEEAGIGVVREGETLALYMNTGDGSWGCGVSLFGPQEWVVGEGPSTDLDGYSTIVLDAEVPDNMVFRVYLEEATVGPPGTIQESELGDDGESFTSELLFGSGTRETFRIPMAEMDHRGDWGNQSGDRRIDLGAMKGIALYFPNGQGEDVVRVHSLRLER